MKRFINQKVFVFNKDTQEKVEGTIKLISSVDGAINVDFGSTQKTYFPIAVIKEKLVFKDEKLQAEAVSLFADLDNQIKEKEEMEEDAKAEESMKRLKEEANFFARRKSGESNVAFKCTFCNGGASDIRIGFVAPCSPDLREFNVKKREWCSNDSCRCKQLLEGKITQEEFDAKINTENDMEFLCYESKMLINWACYAGMTKYTGKPMALNGAEVGSLAVMTTRPVVDGQEAPQEQTQIFGVFLIGEQNDKTTIGGSASAAPKYRIELTPKESSKMLFWKYYSNKQRKEKSFWGTKLHRYLSDMQCCQILRDIVEVVEDPAKKALAQELLDKFQEEIKITTIEEPSGALK